MNIKLFGMTFGAAENIFFLPLVMVGIFLVFWRIAKRRKNVSRLASKVQVALLIKHFSPFKNGLKALLTTIGLIFLFLSLLRPQWSKKEELVLQEGRDLVIAVDISKSMLAKDYKPDRLEFAKKKIKKLVNMLGSERVGLIVFSGATSVQCPLTSDYAAFFMFLDQLDVETIASGTTAIDKPIERALEIFKSMEGKKNKILIIFTDGEDFSSNLAAVRGEAVKENLRIFTMGVGTTEGAPIPIYDDKKNQIGHIKDKKGNIVISRLNEGILSALADETGGIYMRLTESDTDLEKLVSMVKRFEKEKFEDKKMSRLEEQYPYFLLVSFLCLALEWML